MSQDFNNSGSVQLSAFLIHQALKKSKDPIIQKFHISYPYEGCLEENSNAILVAEADEEHSTGTIDSEQYTVITEIYIKTKKADYEEVSKLLRSARLAVKKCLREDKEASKLNPIARSSRAKYSSRFGFKARNLLIKTLEMENI